MANPPSPPTPPDPPPFWLQLLRSRWLWTGIAGFILAATVGLNQFLDSPPNTTSPQTTPSPQPSRILRLNVVKQGSPREVLPNVEVRVFLKDGPPISTQETNSSGYVEIDIPTQQNTVDVTLSKSGYRSKEENINLSQGLNQTFRLESEQENLPNTTDKAPVERSPTSQKPTGSQIYVLFENKWVEIPRADSLNLSDDIHPVSGRKRDAFLFTEEKLNSLDIPTAKIDATVNQLGGNWRNNAPDIWNGTAVTCIVNIRRRGGELNYIPCQFKM